VDETDTAFGAGGYVRGGIDFMLSTNSAIGLGVRAIKTKLDFEDVIGDVDVDGVQGMLTYTIRF
jgi:hypothetical protein